MTEVRAVHVVCVDAMAWWCVVTRQLTNNFTRHNDTTGRSHYELLTTEPATDRHDVTTEMMSAPPHDVHHLSPFDPSFILSDAQRQVAVEVLTYIYYVVVVIVIPPIIFNIIVFLQRSMRSGTSAYVIGLSFAQLLYVLFLAGGEILKAVLDDYFTSRVYWLYAVYLATYVGLTAKRCGYLIMCLMSVERLYAVVRPLHAKTFFLSKRSVWVVCFAFFLSYLWHVYILCREVVREAGVKPNGEKVYSIVTTHLYQTTQEINDAFSLGAKVVLSFTTLLVQLLLNVLTSWALRRHNMAAKQVQSSADETLRRQRERQMTVTILASTIAYVALSIPSAVHNLCYTLFPNDYSFSGKYFNLFVVISALIGNLTVLGTGLDFVCFLTLSSAYRREFFRLLGCKPRARTMRENQTKIEDLKP